MEIGGTVNFGGRAWRVLDVQNGKALILSEKILENRVYDDYNFTEPWVDCTLRDYRDYNFTSTWADCTLRDYLNGAFFNEFSSHDKARIAETRITTNNNPWYGRKGGNATNDRIFLLSLEEVAQYFGDSEQLKNRPGRAYSIDDQYNSARVATDEAGMAWYWWLRSPGNLSCYTAMVHPHGDVFLSGMYVLVDDFGVRPALWLNLYSEIF